MFKAIRNPQKFNAEVQRASEPVTTGQGDTTATHNLMNHGQQYHYDQDTLDKDENGKIKKYAIKRIFPTINASFILIEMLILKYLDGRNNVTELI